MNNALSEDVKGSSKKEIIGWQLDYMSLKIKCKGINKKDNIVS